MATPYGVASVLPPVVYSHTAVFSDDHFTDPEKVFEWYVLRSQQIESQPLDMLTVFLSADLDIVRRAPDTGGNMNRTIPIEKLATMLADEFKEIDDLPPEMSTIAPHPAFTPDLRIGEVC